MSDRIDQAIAKVRQLSEPDQEALASIILQEIEAEHRWEQLFARPDSAELLSKMADVEAGRARKLDVNEL